jgi:hypothetical protein
MLFFGNQSCRVAEKVSALLDGSWSINDWIVQSVHIEHCGVKARRDSQLLSDAPHGGQFCGLINQNDRCSAIQQAKSFDCLACNPLVSRMEEIAVVL